MGNMDIQEVDGTYMEYNYELLATKIDLEEAAAADQWEIERLGEDIPELVFQTAKNN